MLHESISFFFVTNECVECECMMFFKILFLVDGRDAFNYCASNTSLCYVSELNVDKTKDINNIHLQNKHNHLLNLFTFNVECGILLEFLHLFSDFRLYQD